MRPFSELPAIIIDSREQLPFVFDGYLTVRKKLDAGDYSLEGYESAVSAERKSHADIWQSMSMGRARFERCVQRLAKLDRAAIVIECSLTKLCDRPHQIERTNVSSVVGGLISYSVQHGISVFWCDNRLLAERVTLRFLASWMKHRSSVWQTQTTNSPLS